MNFQLTILLINFLELTDHKKEINFYAIQHGYFKVSRKISSSKIAHHFNIIKSVLYDHLRKIERIIYHYVHHFPSQYEINYLKIRLNQYF